MNRITRSRFSFFSLVLEKSVSGRTAAGTKAKTAIGYHRRRLLIETLESRNLLAAVGVVHINQTNTQDDNITLYNPKGSALPYTQTITAEIDNVGSTAGVFTLKAVSTGSGAVKLSDSKTPLLQPGGSFIITITPTHDSSKLNDIHITSTNGKITCLDEMTVVGVSLPADIYNADTPTSMVKEGAYRIPPTATTAIPLTVTPNLGTSTEVSLSLEGAGGNAGDFTVDGNKTPETLTSSKTLNLIGVKQTANNVSMTYDANGEVNNTAAAAGNPNAGKLMLQLQVRGQDTIETKGFSVSAIPIKFTDSFIGAFVGPVTYGISVQDGWSSDSGSVADLDQVAMKEIVQYQDSGVFKGVGHSNSGYIGPSNVFTTDRHTLPGVIVTAKSHTGSTTALQTTEFTDYRAGGVDVTMADSGMKITKTFSVQKIAGVSTVVETTTKVGAVVKAPNGDKVAAGATFVGAVAQTISDTRPVLTITKGAAPALAFASDSRSEDDGDGPFAPFEVEGGTMNSGLAIIGGISASSPPSVTPSTSETALWNGTHAKVESATAALVASLSSSKLADLDSTTPVRASRLAVVAPIGQDPNAVDMVFGDLGS